jgi:hypothetical protein
MTADISGDGWLSWCGRTQQQRQPTLALAACLDAWLHVGSSFCIHRHATHAGGHKKRAESPKQFKV